MANRPSRNNLSDRPGCNFWVLDQDIWENTTWVPHGLDVSVFIPTDPHCYVEGWVQEIKDETDGDKHMWVTFQPNGVARFVAEFDPYLMPDQLPNVGDHIGVWGIYRWDGQHKWPEVHPVLDWKGLD